MKIIVTGGAGVIGEALTQELSQAGHEITVFSRNAQKRVAGAQTALWNLEEFQSWLPHIEKSDAVVHLAGENLAGEGFFPSRWTAERKKRIRESRVVSGNILSKAIQVAQNKPKVFIQASAIGYYGPRGDELLAETTPPGDDFLSQTCVQWEDSTKVLDELPNTRRVIIRTGIVLTPKSGALARLLLPYRLFAGGPFGNGQQWYSWVHMADEVAAIRFLLEHPEAKGVFNLTAPNPLTNRDFGKTLGNVLNRPSLIPIPKFAMKAAFGEVATVVVDGQRVLPNRLIELGYPFKFNHLEPALRDLLT